MHLNNGQRVFKNKVYNRIRSPVLSGKKKSNVHMIYKTELLLNLSIIHRFQKHEKSGTRK